jgi:zinc transporter ZupT
MSPRATRNMLGAGLIVFLAGTARDLQWHATHDTQREFETAAKQIEVHWLLWLGALVIIAAAGLALRRTEMSRQTRGYLVAFAAGIVYAIVSVWHFIEHAEGADPQVAHVFLYASAGLMVAGVVRVLIVMALSRQGPEQPGAAPGDRAA